MNGAAAAADPVAQMIARVASGDRRAFRDLYAAASAKLFGTLLRILKDRQEAEDALQEVFTRVWQNAGRFDPARARGMTWLIAIARNRAIDRLRARPEKPLADDDAAAHDLPDPGPGAERRLIAAGEAQRLHDCFDTLETDRAAALRGAYLDGDSYLSLAERHGVPLNTMRTWLRRGLQKLRECLDA